MSIVIERLNEEFKASKFFMESTSNAASLKSQQYFHDFLEAILNIKRSYYCYIPDDEGKELSHLERVFAYELYHQWSKLIESNPNYYISSDNISLCINGEIGKNFLQNGIDKYPDMVLHGGQGDCNHQEIVVEIKRSKNLQWVNSDETAGVKIDMDKLFDMMDNGKMFGGTISPYKTGVFVIALGSEENASNHVNETLQEIIGWSNEKINNYENNGTGSKNPKEILENLYCVICAGTGKLIYFNLLKRLEFFSVHKLDEFTIEEIPDESDNLKRESKLINMSK